MTLNNPIKLVFICIIFTSIQTMNGQTGLDFFVKSSWHRMVCYITFADMNGDGNEDLLISSGGRKSQIHTKLYFNDGAGNFVESVDTTFRDFQLFETCFFDCDGDEDIDLLVTGKEKYSESFTKLYLNDGKGHFAQKREVPFNELPWENISVEDIDGDGDKDIMISDNLGMSNSVTKIFANDGHGVFIETESFFEASSHSNITPVDVDGDGDKDLMFAGFSDKTMSAITKLYTNDGRGKFDESNGETFEKMHCLRPVVFADFDNDGDEDIFMYGNEKIGQRLEIGVFKIYTNDGKGTFKELKPNPFGSVAFSRYFFADVNGDEQLDVLLSGIDVNNSYQRVTKLFVYDTTTKGFIEIETPFGEAFLTLLDFSDMDKDGDQDIVTFDTYRLKIYLNDGKGGFYEQN